MTPESPRPSSVYFFGTCRVDSFYPEAGLAAKGIRVSFYESGLLPRSK